MENIIIRKATITDLYLIQELNNKLFYLEYNNFDSTLQKNWALTKESKEYFTNMINKEIVYVAINDNEIVGYLAGSICDKCSYIIESFAEIDNMCIDDSYRGRGIGTLLINRFKEYCTEKGIQNIKVTASTKNNNAINFYIKNGFEDYNRTLKIKIQNTGN